MGYLRTLESNTTWVCPKTATYKIICVASGNAYNTAGEPTSFGSYCTAYGSWDGNTSGYTLFSYGDSYDYNASGNKPKAYGYGCSVDNSGYACGMGRLNVAIADIEKDTEIVCTVGKAVTGVVSDSKSVISMPGLIVIQEIGEVSGNIVNNEENDVEYTINLYRYTELYTTLKIKAGSPLILPALPIYYEGDHGDIEHKGFATSLGGNKVYNVNQTIFPIMDMDLYAGYSYKTALSDGSLGSSNWRSKYTF